MSYPACEYFLRIKRKTAYWTWNCCTSSGKVVTRLVGVTQGSTQEKCVHCVEIYIFLRAIDVCESSVCTVEHISNLVGTYFPANILMGSDNSQKLYAWYKLLLYMSFETEY